MLVFACSSFTKMGWCDCSICTALLRATHVLTQPGVFCSPSLHHGLRDLAGEGSVALHPFICPLHSHGSSAGRSLTLGGSHHLPHQPHHEPAELCTPLPGPGSQAPSSRASRAPKPWLFSAGSCCQPLPGGSVTRDVLVLPLLCAPHKA